MRSARSAIAKGRRRRAVAAIAAAAAASAVASSDAFVVPSPTSRNNHHMPSILLMAKQSGRKKKLKGQPGKRRFPQQSSSAFPTYDDDTSSSSSPPQEAAEDVPTSASVMQTTKSIEELEQIMSKRWGTSGDGKWTADFDEEELVYGDDNDEDSYHDDGGAVGNVPPARLSNTPGGSKKKFKAKPVLDPWQKAAEVERKKNEPKASPADDDGRKKGRGMFGGVGGEDAVLDRVRRNQEKMREKREAKVMANAPKKSKKGGRRSEQMEFYDEDDEGYEGGEDGDEGIDVAFDAIIAPKPAAASGGRDMKSKRNSEDNDDGSSGGFFFRQSPESEASVAAAASTTEEDQKTDKKPKERKPQQPVKRDANGKEMLLTLEQAEKNVEEYLASISAAAESPSEDNNVSDEDDPLAVNDWEDVGITEPKLLKNLRQSMRCPQPLSVQDKACPPILSGTDVLVSTHTGSGKTLAFLAPLAQRMLIDAAAGAGQADQGVKVVVVAPGRELASQIVSVARELLEGTGLKVLLTIGGTPFSRSVEAIRKKKPDIVVGTPGRIAELIVGAPGAKSGRLKLNSLQTIVLDEFDALLEYEPHRDPTNAVMRTVKRRHNDSLQSVLCSATAADMMGKELLDEMLRPGFAHAQVDEGDRLITSAHGDKDGAETTTRVSRTAIHGAISIPDKRLKLETLRRVLYTEPTPQQVLVFVDNSRRVGIVVDKLAQIGIVAAPLHGGFGSEKTDRAEVSKALREGFVGIVVATELAARGIDAPYLTHVVNLDLPTDASHYAHRAGRCGRGGRPGVVVNIAAGPREKKVPNKFADALGIEINAVEPRAGKLVILQEDDKKSEE